MGFWHWSCHSSSRLTTNLQTKSTKMHIVGVFFLFFRTISFFFQFMCCRLHPGSYICKMLQWLLNQYLIIICSFSIVIQNMYQKAEVTNKCDLRGLCERIGWWFVIVKDEQVREERSGAREQDKRKKKEEKEWRKVPAFLIYGSEGTTGAAKRIIIQKTRRWDDRSATNE